MNSEYVCEGQQERIVDGHKSDPTTTQPLSLASSLMRDSRPISLSLSLSTRVIISPLTRLFRNLSR